MKLVSRADVARLRGISKAAVTRACRSALAPACHGDRVNLNHPAAVAYLASNGKPGPRKSSSSKPTKPTKKVGKTASAREVSNKAPAKQVTKTAPAKAATKPVPAAGGSGRKRRSSGKATAGTVDDSAPPLDENGFAPELSELVAREIAELYGTSRNYVDWLDAYQKLERARDLWLKNETTEGRLIERELVEHHVFGFIDSVFKRLLVDASKTIAARTQALSRSGSSQEEIESVVRDIISKQLMPMKATAARVLRNA